MRRFASMLLLAGLLITAAGPLHAQRQSFVVYFQEWSAAIDGPAQDVIANAAAHAKAHPAATMRVVGFADPTGSRAANILLSQLRAQVVSDALVKAGVFASRISKTGRGAVQFSATALESRRVEIRMSR